MTQLMGAKTPPTVAPDALHAGIAISAQHSIKSGCHCGPVTSSRPLTLITASAALGTSHRAIWGGSLPVLSSPPPYPQRAGGFVPCRAMPCPRITKISQYRMIICTHFLHFGHILSIKTDETRPIKYTLYKIHVYAVPVT